jgi:DNA-binding NarL/FixJ family response regulator
MSHHSTPERTAVLVDQAPLWMDSVEHVIGRTGVTVLAKLTSAAVAAQRIAELQPDLLVTGITMADGQMDGLQLIGVARAHVPGIKAIVLSMCDDAAHISAAFEAGADAYVLKTAHPDDLVSATRQAFQHSMFLAGAVGGPVRAPAPAPADESPALTRREREILRLVAEGHSNAQLARMLWVTEQTVKFHLSNIYRKLDVSNRTEASRWAQLQGLLAEPVATALAA